MIYIHFHVLSLHFSDKYSRRVRDLHLLKKLSAVLDQIKHEEGLLLILLSVNEKLLCRPAKGYS